MVSVILLMDSGESVARTVSSRDSENPNIFNCLPKAKMVRWHSARAAAAISLSCSCTICRALLPASSDKNGSEISSLCKLREGQTRPTPLFTQSPRLYK